MTACPANCPCQAARTDSQREAVRQLLAVMGNLRGSAQLLLTFYDGELDSIHDFTRRSRYQRERNRAKVRPA